MVYSARSHVHRAVQTCSGGFGIAGAFIILLKFWLPCSCFYANATAFPPLVEKLRGAGHPGQGSWLCWTEATTYPIALLSGDGAALFISTHIHTYIHWDYGNAGGLEHKHSPLPGLLSFATVNVMLSFYKVKKNWWYSPHDTIGLFYYKYTPTKKHTSISINSYRHMLYSMYTYCIHAGLFNTLFNVGGKTT